MGYDEIMDETTKIDRSEVEHLLRSHGHDWDVSDEGEFFDANHDERIVTPDFLGEYPSAHVMHWLGY